MNKHKQTAPSAPFSLEELVGVALKGRQDITAAKRRLRTTYLKEAYFDIFPGSFFFVRNVPSGGASDKPRTRSFGFRNTQASRRFIRNLWFLEVLRIKRSEIVEFMTKNMPARRAAIMSGRLEEILVLAEVDRKLSAAAVKLRQASETFDPAKTDLLRILETTGGAPETSNAPGFRASDAGISELIREIERRASYLAGKPEDACEKALYFLALRRPDIARRIAQEVLERNPDNAIALYTNAVLLVDAGERHRERAFMFDIMHPHNLPPVDSEEQWHVDQHDQEKMEAWKKEAEAFLLMLRARRQWPERFKLDFWELEPGAWKGRIDDWIFRQAALRLAGDPAGLSLLSEDDAKAATGMLASLVFETWHRNRRWLLEYDRTDFLRDFLTVTRHLDPDVGRECLRSVEKALGPRVIAEHDAPAHMWALSDHHCVRLPVSSRPGIAEVLVGAIGNEQFCEDCVHLDGPARALELFASIRRRGEADRADRHVIRRTLALRRVVLSQLYAKAGGTAAGLCARIVAEEQWPESEVGVLLRCCWNYSHVLSLFKGSCDACEDGNLGVAWDLAEKALAAAIQHFDVIAGDKPLLAGRESDEFGDADHTGDLLLGLSNVVTSMPASEWFGRTVPWSILRGSPACWEKLVLSPGANDPALLAYGRWLAGHDPAEAGRARLCEQLGAALKSHGSASPLRP